MNLRLYRQKKRMSSTGKMIYQGQDSHPYADNDLLIVADGLGGRGGFPHTTVDERVLDDKEIYDVLFGGVFTEQVSDDFKHFVIHNFEELFIARPYYRESDEYIRRSGYFASRIVVAIVLHELKYNPLFDKKVIFESIEGASDDERDEIAARIGAELAKIVAEKLATVAERGGFELEVKNKGAYLLPTTLTVALLNEKEHEVEVLYLWAGDSRGYTWSVDGGMCQVTEDHEQDETMTNNISLSRDFTIEGRFLNVPRPCAIFLASDGVYKPPAFLCPIDQEVLFLSSVLGHEDAESAMGWLEQAYDSYSPDDSSTLAFKSYDYDDYAKLKAAFNDRMERINKDYTSILPDIFDRDYSGELLRLEAPLSSKLESVCDELAAIPGIFEILRQDMINKNYPPYLDELAELKAADTVAHKRAVAEAKIREWVCDNWLRGAWLRRHTPAANEPVDGINEKEDFADYAQKCSVLKEEHKDSINKARRYVYDAHKEHLAPLFDKFSSLVNTSTSSDEDREAILAARDAVKRAVDRVSEYLIGVLDGDDEVIVKYVAINERRQLISEKAIEQDREVIDATVEKIISDPDSVGVNGGYAKWKDAIKDLHDEYAAICDSEKGLPTEEDIARKHVPNYLKGNDRLYGFIWNSHRHLLPEELIEKMIGDDTELLNKRAELRAGIATREELYAKYNKGYYKDYRSSRI